MGLLESLEDDFAKFTGADHVCDSLAGTRSLITQLEDLYAKLEADEETDCSHVSKMTKTWAEKQRKNLKSSNSAINKFGKCIDRIEPLDDVYQYRIDKTPRNLTIVENAVRLHLLREGDLGLNIGQEDVMAKFSEMNSILKALNAGSLKSAIDWVTLHARNTELEFMLHRAQYLAYYKSGDILQALKYAQQSFPGLVQENPETLKSVPKLIASVMFKPDDTKSPYYAANQVSSSHFTELCLLFSKQFCSYIGFSFESSLFTILLAAHVAFPFFSKLQKLKATTKLEWTSTDELPIEVHIPDSLQFHAIYICPVFKCEITRDNPAMSLPCHHIVCRQALMHLCKNGGSFKCPYCPATALTAQCKQVEFHAI